MRLPTVLVTRPSPQGEKLCAAINAAGGVGIFFPTMFIKPIVTPSVEAYFNTLSKFDTVIFISPNAVYHSIAVIRQYHPTWPPNTRIAAIGAGTAEALKEQHLIPSIVPESHFSSESLLNHPALLDVMRQKILIVRGKGGKTLLADTLQARGAQLFHAITYTRQRPQGKTATLSKMLHNKIDAIVTTSEENLLNLWAIADERDKPKLSSIPLLVISVKMVTMAKHLGFTTVLLTDNPRNETMILTLFGTQHERKN